MKEYADTAAKAKPHNFQVGDTVLVRQKRVNKLSSPYNKHPYTIVKIKGSMITGRNTTSYITRNSSQFKKITVGFYRLCSATFWQLFAFEATFYDISNFKQLLPGNA
jgi:hypothetical protein